MNSKEALKRLYNDIISLNEIEEDIENITKDYEQIKQDLDRLEKLEKDLKQTKSNFKNSQTHSRNCYIKILDKYMGLEKENTKLKKIIDFIKENLYIEFYHTKHSKDYIIQIGNTIINVSKEKYYKLKEILN